MSRYAGIGSKIGPKVSPLYFRACLIFVALNGLNFFSFHCTTPPSVNSKNPLSVLHEINGDIKVEDKPMKLKKSIVGKVIFCIWKNFCHATTILFLKILFLAEKKLMKYEKV